VSVAQFFVYLYRDEQGRARYVGYGREAARASSHLLESHNARLNQFLEARKYKLEIAGPFESERMGRAVETALISALKPDLNIDPGQSRWRFRPFGIPLHYAERLAERELDRRDFLACQGANPHDVLFVIISNQDFDDSREGYNPERPLSDTKVKARMERWWQLGRHVLQWAQAPEQSPGLLVGISGSPGQQLVIGSVLIDRAAWHHVSREKGGLISIPLGEPFDLDAFSLRGRRVARSAGIRFGSFTSQQYVRLAQDETLSGGQPPRS
jgi:hypothetical protein